MRDGGDSELVDPCGNALPPCIVMERGESLQEWADRAEPDLFTSLSVRTPDHSPACADLHAITLVHEGTKQSASISDCVCACSCYPMLPSG